MNETRISDATFTCRPVYRMEKRIQALPDSEHHIDNAPQIAASGEQQFAFRNEVLQIVL